MLQLHQPKYQQQPFHVKSGFTSVHYRDKRNPPTLIQILSKTQNKCWLVGVDPFSSSFSGRNVRKFLLMMKWYDKLCTADPWIFNSIVKAWKLFYKQCTRSASLAGNLTVININLSPSFAAVFPLWILNDAKIYFSSSSSSLFNPDKRSLVMFHE